MRFRTILSGAVATLVFCGVATAAGPNAGLPGVFPVQGQPRVTLAQAGTQGLEEQIRQLNGRVEELNFQILQLQEQIRKMQEDNEFRFQELEGGKKSDAGDGQSPRRHAQAETARPAEQTTPSPGPDATAEAPAQMAQAPTDGGAGQTAIDATPGQGEPPRAFGTIVFDQNGNVVGGSVGDQATVSRDPQSALPHDDSGAADETIVAALPPTNDPEELYRTSYDAILSGQYKAAEVGFRQHAERFPEDARAADTQFWLGESLLSQQKYRDAAEVFLAAGKKYPKAKKAPEMLFKLGVSLAGINQRDVACATFAAVGERYPNASETLKKRVAREQAEVRC